MEIKVKEVSNVEEKSVQQVEQELLDKHEKKIAAETSTESAVIETKNDSEPVEKVEVKTEKVEETPSVEPSVEKEEIKSNELTEDEVLKFIGNRYGKDIKSLDELNSQREKEPLPEDVSKYLKYKKETGRGFDDFAKLQRSYEDMEPDQLLREYLTATEKGLDADDITDLMEDYYYDEDVDDDKTIKKIKLAKKKTIAKAKDFFQQQQEQYKVPLESRTEPGSGYSEEEIEGYRKYVAEAKTSQENFQRKQEVFEKKTDDVFSEFKGFEFDIDNTKVYFSPGDASELKKSQLTPQNWVNKFLDEDGVMIDAEGYHKSLALAMHPEKFARFFYEQGKSAAADNTMRELKNINMETKRAPEVTKTNNGLQIRALNNDSGRGLKIRKRK